MPKDSAIGVWRLRNGTYAKVESESEVGCWQGTVYQEDGKPFCKATWDRRFNNLITRDLDLMDRLSGSLLKKGDPAWLQSLL